MRQSETSGIKAQGAETTVPSTKQTSAPKKRAKKFPYFIQNMRTPDLFTEEAETYSVSFSAEVKKEFGGNWCDLEFSNIYHERHPLLALGMAIADCDAKYNQVKLRLNNIRIEKR